MIFFPNQDGLCSGLFLHLSHGTPLNKSVLLEIVILFLIQNKINVVDAQKNRLIEMLL